MRIFYIAHTRFPTEKAHGKQMAHVCAALADLGHDVTLLAPTVWNAITDDAFTYYGLKRSFKVEKLKHFDALKSPLVPGVLGFAVGMFFYKRALKKYFKHQKADLLYVRAPTLVSALLSSGVPIVLELHALPRYAKKLFLYLCLRVKKVVCLTSAMRDELCLWGVPEEQVIVEADAVDLSAFASLPSATDAKKKFELPSDRSIIGYVGSLKTRGSMEKGVRELIDALAMLKNENVYGWIVGGSEAERKEMIEYASHVGLNPQTIQFQGFIPSAEVPAALRACDVCVYPVPASDHPFFHRDTSPLKLFEYLASGTPTVAADTSPVRDIVDEQSVTFCKAGDAPSLASAIKNVLRDTEKAATKAKNGVQVVQGHSWEKRMERVLSEVQV